MANGKKVIVGMSGGVDSAVAALLLKREGYDVTGLFMHNWEDGGECNAAEDWADACRAAERIGIECYSVSFAEEYMNGVFEYFLREYRAYRTPNPDVLCNRVVKFGAFRDYCATLGAEYIATGHYCAKGEPTALLRAADTDKDQTYFLNQVQTQQLDNVLFPLGALKKSEVRAIAESAGLSVAHKKDSTGVCFIGERRFKKFLAEYLPANAGDIVDTSGAVVGRHDGLMYYTLGQRRGLGIGGVKGETGRWFVLGKDVARNRLIVSCGDERELYSAALEGSEFNIIGDFDMPETLECTAKTRYRQPDFPARLKMLGGGRFSLEFGEPQRAVTPGQYAVIYVGDRCLGGGVIEKTIK